MSPVAATQTPQPRVVLPHRSPAHGGHHGHVRPRDNHASSGVDLEAPPALPVPRRQQLEGDVGYDDDLEAPRRVRARLELNYVSDDDDDSDDVLFDGVDFVEKRQDIVTQKSDSPLVDSLLIYETEESICLCSFVHRYHNRLLQVEELRLSSPERLA